MKVFKVNKTVINGEQNFCLVCKKKFKLNEDIILLPIQEPKGDQYISAMAIPLHYNRYYVE